MKEISLITFELEANGFLEFLNFEFSSYFNGVFKKVYVFIENNLEI